MFDLQEEIEEKNYIISFVENVIKELHNNLTAIKNTDITHLEKASHIEEKDYYLHREWNRLEKKHYLESFTEDDHEEIDDTYGKTISKLIKKEISDENVASKFTNIIKDIVIQGLLKDIWPRHCTSIVIVGFVKKEVHPVICELQIEGRVNRKLKYIYKLTKITTEDVMSYNITSFARARLPMYSFTESINYNLEEYLFNGLHDQFQQANNNILKGLKEETEDLREVEQLLSETFSNLLEDVKEDFTQYKKQ